MFVIEVALKEKVLVERKQISGRVAFVALSKKSEEQFLNFVDVDPGVLVYTGDFAIHRNKSVQHGLLQISTIVSAKRWGVRLAERNFKGRFDKQKIS